MKVTETIICVLLKLIGENGRIAAVTEEVSAIRYMQNPEQSVQDVVIAKNPLFIEYIKNPSRETQAAAVAADYRALKNIENPDPEIAMLAKLSE